MIELIQQPWPWYIAGPVIGLVMVTLLFFGNTLGISSNLRTTCAAFGGGKFSGYFDFQWKEQVWNLVFLLGLVIGGFLSSSFLSSDSPLPLSEGSLEVFRSLGLEEPGTSLVPLDLFQWGQLATLPGFVMLVIGGLLVGFGTQYAGGCTSGHAISGLSDFQIPSLIAVIAVFIGGLISTHLIIPILLKP